jgi:chemotaxis protein methyltransferase CheR
VSDVLDLVAELVRRESGIKLQPSQHGSLRAAIGRAEPGADPLRFLRLAEDPVWGREAVARLVDEVTVNETSFFRDRRQLETIAWRLLLERAHEAGSSEVRVWSTACATGEEVYTLAMLAAEALASGDPPVRVLGTDISSSALEAALAGRYGSRSIRGIEPSLRRRWFEEDGDRLVVNERLRRFVAFTPHNLARDPIPPAGELAFDLIVCRNVLIYFDSETVERVIGSLEGALRAGGTLILGSADTLCGTVRRLERLASSAKPEQPKRPERPRRGAAPQRTLRRPLGRLTEPEARPLDPLDADAWFLRGLHELQEDEPATAAASLRRALYVDPTFGLAAFTLGRAHEAAGDVLAARRAYEQALRTLDLADDRHDHLLQQVDLTDIATACRVRLAALR